VINSGLKHNLLQSIKQPVDLTAMLMLNCRTSLIHIRWKISLSVHGRNSHPSCGHFPTATTAFAPNPCLHSELDTYGYFTVVDSN